MNITNKIVRSKIKYAAYMFVFITVFIGHSAQSASTSSNITVLAAAANSNCDKFGQVLGTWVGTFQWPTNSIIINVASNCIIPRIKERLKQEMASHGHLGYLISTDVKKVYAEEPEVSFNARGGITVSIRYSGWNRDKLEFGLFSKKRYGFGFASIDYKPNLTGYTIDFSIRDSRTTPAFPFEFEADLAYGIANTFPIDHGVESIMSELYINLESDIIKSTNIVSFYEKITGLSDAKSNVKSQIFEKATNVSLFIDSNYMTLVILSPSLYQDVRRDFRSVAGQASNGLLHDSELDALFFAIRYPQGPFALELLAGRGIGHENNQAPKAFSVSDLQVNFNKSIDFTPQTSDPENDPLTYSEWISPSHGKLYIINNGKFKLRYEPTNNFSGSDQFVYRIKDPYGLSDTEKVSVNVNPNRKPTALRTGLVINWNEAVSFVPRASDPDEDNLRYSVPEDKKPKHGTVTSILDGSRLDYIADLDFEGSDQFEYRVQDPYGLFSTAQVDVTVIRPKKNLVVNKTGSGKGIISSNPDFIDCGPYCLEDVPIDSVITLVPTPDSGSVFRGWDGGCSSAGLSNCTLTMNKAQIAIARFDIAPTSFTLTVDKTGNGSGIVTSNAVGIDCGDDCTEDYLAGANTQVTLSPAPVAGSTFRGWTGACSGTSACTVIMSQNRDVGVTFEAAVPTVFTVSNLNDSGAGSLRQAITDANANPGNDSIFFQSGLGGTIILTNGQLEVTDSVVIRGPGAKVLAISGNNISRVLAIEPGTLGTVDISGLTLKQGNDTTGEGGGGMIINNGTVSISECSLIDNSANVGGGGGGIRKYGPGWLNITNTTISGNSALDEFDQGEGGGIRTDQDTLTISNSTVSGNSAANAGGISFDEGRLTISNSTVTGNSALNGGGGIFTAGGDLFLENSVIAGNTAPADKEIQNFGTTHSLGHNLFGENGASGVTSGITLADNDLILAGAITSAIAPLADNGGQTQTHLPVAGGPAIDSGENLLIPSGLTEDQRGIDFPRIMNGTVDIGAVEKIITHTLSVNKTGGNGTITSNPAGIDCGNTCTHAFTENSLVTLDVTSGSGSTFTGWSGACSGLSACVLTMSANQSVTASFTASTGGTDTIPPTLSNLSPTDNATGVAVSANLITTFNEAIQAGAGNFIISYASGTVAQTIAVIDASQVSISGSTVTINPNTNLASGSSYYVTMTAGVIKDLAGNSFAGITDTTAYNFMTAAVPDNRIIKGTSANDTLRGTSGNDTFDDSGAAGIDTVIYPAVRSNYVISNISPGFIVSSSTDGTDTLTHIERLQFSDGNVALDINGNAGQVYRLYQAAFDRQPDADGLGYWINQMDRGTSLEQVASGFINSTEFRNLYGTNPTNAQFVTNLYNNVLHRPLDQAGFDYWVNALAGGGSTRNQVLAGFSESAENQANVIGVIRNGIVYTQPINQVTGTSTNDTLAGTSGNDAFNGGTGIDTALFTTARSNYIITKTSTGFTVSGGGDGTDTLINTERLQFSDGNVALDIDGNAGQVYRLYQAAFDRQPDSAGLGYWINQMDHGTTLEQIASGFINSTEFSNLYGANPSNAQFVTNLYNNVLHRPLDQAGFDYWVNALAGGGSTRNQVLAGFSESAENQANVIGVIRNGIEYAQ